MNQNNETIICPNCGKAHDIASADGPGMSTLDGLQAIIATVTPLLLGLFAVILLGLAGMFWKFTLSAGLICGVFFGTAVIAFPFMIRIMINYQKALLKSLGVQLCRITCSCRADNTFTVIRPIATEPEKTLNELAHELFEVSIET